MPKSALADRGMGARAGLALALANVRYWTSVVPIVRSELRRWTQRARAIEDPELRALALDKLHDEGFHAEAAAMLATVAPRQHRSSVVEAIVALELLFDYLDGLTERPSNDPIREGERLFTALTDAVAARPDGALAKLEVPQDLDGGYLELLSRSVADAIARLPAAPAITQLASSSAERSAQVQIRMHAVAALGTGQLEEWGTAQAEGTGLGWRELAAGAASSVLVLHALIAAAAQPHTTPVEAHEVATAYMSTCVMLTLLDGLIDRAQDRQPDGSSTPGYLDLYDDPAELADVVGDAARRAAAQARRLPDGAHHTMMLVGVAAYYCSMPGAQDALARPVLDRLRSELAPLATPTLALMRGWRTARRLTRSSGAKQEGES